LAGVGAIAGIGFTVSLFIADLAFGPTMGSAAKLGILTGSLAAGLVGSAIVLRGSGSHLTRAVFGGDRPGN
jgi:NhaA family Na+:H+ antiporter